MRYLRIGLVELDETEGGGSDGTLEIESSEQAPHQRGLSGAEFSGEENDISGPEPRGERCSEFEHCFFAFGEKFLGRHGKFVVY